MGDCLSNTSDGYILRIRLTPSATKNAVGGTFTDEKGQDWLKASVTAAPEKGKANKALIDQLSKMLKIRKSAIALISGETDRHKTLRIADDLDETIIHRLGAD